MIKIILLLVIIGGAVAWYKINSNHTQPLTVSTVFLPIAQPTTTPTPKPQIIVPTSKILPNTYHIFQSFNNCGPAALSMALSYYGVNVSQQELGRALRPHQNPQGVNDDKSVTLAELAEKSKEYGFTPYHRPNGSIETVKKLIAADIPIITRTWLKENEDIGHYRVIKGYDENRGILIQDDSLQGKNLEYTYDQFNRLWQKFNYEYLALIPKDKQHLVAEIFGQDLDENIAWKRAVTNAEKQLTENPNDLDARFNLSVALYRTGDYRQSVAEFEKIENQLPFRTLWYQIEPIQAYYELEKYDRVLSLTAKILNYHNLAFSELYLIRGKVYRKLNQPDLARVELEKALQYKPNSEVAKEASDLIQDL